MEGLTGRSPSEWAKSFGEYHRTLIEGASEETTEPDEENTRVEVIEGSPEAPTMSESDTCKEELMPALISILPVSKTGVPPLKWSTHWDRNILFRRTIRWQASETNRKTSF